MRVYTHESFNSPPTGSQFFGSSLDGGEQQLIVTEHLEAYRFANARGGICQVAERPLVLANRFRTGSRSIVVNRLWSEIARPGAGILVLSTDGHVMTSAKVRTPQTWIPVSMVELVPDTTYFIAAELEAGDRYYLGTEIPSAHSELTDLGTWSHESFPGMQPVWKPSHGPRMLTANFAFQLGAPKRASARESQIMELAAQGLTDRQIAQRLGLSCHTVESHWRSARKRTNSSSRTECVAKHLTRTIEKEREDIEAQRDRAIAEAWLRDFRVTPRPAAEVIRSWPRI